MFGTYFLLGLIAIIPCSLFMNYKLSPYNYTGYIMTTLGISFLFLSLPVLAPILLIMIGIICSGGMRSGVIGDIVRQVEIQVGKVNKEMIKKSK